MPLDVLERHYLVQGEEDEEGVEQQFNSSSRRTMGNANAVSATDSCTSGIESVKGDILTVVTSENVQELMYELEKEQASCCLEEAAEESQNRSSRSVKESGQSLIVSNTNNNTGDGSHPHPNLHLSRRHPKKFLKRSWRKSHNVLHKITHAVGDTIHKLEELIFPRTPPLLGGSVTASAAAAHTMPQTVATTTRVRGGVLLQGCHTDDEHKEKVRECIELLRPLYGQEGLKAINLEYRVVSVDYENMTSEEKSMTSSPSNSEPDLSEENDAAESERGEEKKDEEHTTNKEQQEVVVPSESCTPASDSIETDPFTLQTRLFHTETNTMLTERNRKQFVADGDFYDDVARLAQEVAQETMIQEGHLKWVTVCDAGNNPEPIRVLVSSNVSDDESEIDVKPTLLIATGRGKVRAGIFSRQHLLLSGMECSTALPNIREAVKRDMNVIMLDPNVHGDRMGMVTFEKSMARIFRKWEQQEPEQGDSPSETHPSSRDLFVLSHSQSGAQLARYLLEKSEHYVPHIRAIAFTDSTHNIQWARENKELHQLLESDSCLYFKASTENSEDRLKPLDTLGKEVETDHFWLHRFGQIRTRCAGTGEHALTNWFAHRHIWEHFDSFLKRSISNSSFSKHQR